MIKNRGFFAAGGAASGGAVYYSSYADSQQTFATITKMTTDGDLVWSNDYAMGGNQIRLGTDGSGGVYAALSGSSLLYKINSDGTVAWTADTTTAVTNNTARLVEPYRDGYSYSGLNLIAKIAPNGVALSSGNWPVTSAGSSNNIRVQDNSVALADGSIVFEQVNSNPYIVKLDSNGNFLWEYYRGFGASQIGSRRLCADPSGNIYYKEGSTLVKLNANGTFGGSVSRGFTGIECGPGGYIFAVDASTASIYKYNSALSLVATIPIEAIGPSGSSLRIDPAGNFYLFTTNNRFAKHAPDGTFIWEYDAAQSLRDLVTSYGRSPAIW